jgi:hypothetical protein
MGAERQEGAEHSGITAKRRARQAQSAGRCRLQGTQSISCAERSNQVTTLQGRWETLSRAQGPASRAQRRRGGSKSWPRGTEAIHLLLKNNVSVLACFFFFLSGPSRQFAVLPVVAFVWGAANPASFQWHWKDLLFFKNGIEKGVLGVRRCVESSQRSLSL